MRTSMWEASDRIPLPIPCRPGFGITNLPCWPISKISPKRLTLPGFCMMSREFLTAKRISSLLSGKSGCREVAGGETRVEWPGPPEAAAVGWHGDRRCPYQPHLTSSAGLRMSLLSNRGALRPDLDAA